MQTTLQGRGLAVMEIVANAPSPWPFPDLLAEQAAIPKLKRATGRAIIVASTAKQLALEGIEGHGTFTYALLQALACADAGIGNRDGITSLFELAQYVDTRVPQITKKQLGYEQIPQVRLVGSDFPLGVVGMHRP